MEVLEEGNLMDRVPILLQRDLQFYQTHQRILQEPICSGIVGGKLDFPRYASFASIKIVLWWEDEYFASYRKHSGLLHTEKDLAQKDLTAINVKSSDPDKFVSLVIKSADLLLEHLHHLSQESLDHADLSVLSATLGAAALVRNSLYIYLKAASCKICPPKGVEKGGALKLSHKQYSQLAEALAERLLDLHCRLLSLYIIQDADCLQWENTHTFFESERGSYTVQMWWHYMDGTKDDLWNSVPPKMAQRIFAGMLNETLSILAVRYSQVLTTTATAQLHLDDICNLLLCVAELLPHICENGEAYIGLQHFYQSATIRDVHAKCQELLYCFLIRAAPLGILSKIFRKGVENMDIFSTRLGFPNTWLTFSAPFIFAKINTSLWGNEFSNMGARSAIALELKVLLAFPEADWPYLVKVLIMRNCFLTKFILRHLLKHLPSPENFKNVATHVFVKSAESAKCGAFLCRRDCLNTSEEIFTDKDPVGQSNYQIVFSLVYLIANVGKDVDIKSCLIDSLENVCVAKWSYFLDKTQIWNQKRPPWLEALINLIDPLFDNVVQMLVDAMEAGASTYQVMSLSLTCISEIWNCIPTGLQKTAYAFQEIIPTCIRPLGDSVLMQIVFAGLFTSLVRTGDHYEKSGNQEKSSICYAISEAICSIDENDKHTDQIRTFLKQVDNSAICQSNDIPKISGLRTDAMSAVSTVNIDDIGISDIYQISHSPALNYASEFEAGSSDFIFGVHASNVLTSNIGKQVLKVTYNYLKNNREWLMGQLNTNGNESSFFEGVKGQDIKEKNQSVLKRMFFIGNKPFDQLLTGSLQIDYASLLETPLSINTERTWLHISRRCDFQSEAKLSISEVAMVAGILKTIKKSKNICGRV